MSALSDLKIFKTPAHQCSYLSEQEATTIFIDPKSALETIQYQELTDLGFRRSGEHIYRPFCETCSSCISVRVPVNDFLAKRHQRRLLNKSKHLNYNFYNNTEKLEAKEYFSLYQHYIEVKHRDGDMYPPTHQQYQEFLLSKHKHAGFMEIRHEKQLLAVCVFDQLQNGLSAIYTFYAPEYKKISLGKLAILKLIERCQKLDKEWLYLGYWIKESPKMAYKVEFRPIELFLKNTWKRLT